MKRITISISEELADIIVALRKTDRFCRCSFAEIIRYLMAQGAAAAEDTSDRLA